MEKGIKSISVEALEKLLEKYKNKIGFDQIEPNVLKFWTYNKYCPGKEKMLGMRRLV